MKNGGAKCVGNGTEQVGSGSRERIGGGRCCERVRRGVEEQCTRSYRITQHVVPYVPNGLGRYNNLPGRSCCSGSHGPPCGTSCNHEFAMESADQEEVERARRDPHASSKRYVGPHEGHGAEIIQLSLHVESRMARSHLMFVSVEVANDLLSTELEQGTLLVVHSP